MNPPIDFLEHDKVDDKCDEHSRPQSCPKHQLDDDNRHCIDDEKKQDGPGSPGEIHVRHFLYGSPCGVMHVVLFRKKACGKMQQTPVKEVFESVRVEESRAEAEKKTGELEGENCRKDASEASAQHRRDNGVVPLDLETTRNRRRAWRVKVHDM